MNCPMCGAPLSPNDYECPKCYTKRSEMGPAYNNNGAYGGYGNNGYGGNNYNTGYGTQNNGYGNTNPNYGNTSYYNGLGNNSPLVRANRGAGRTVGWIIAILVVLVVAVFMFFVRPNMYKKFDMGDFTVELPMNCSDTSSSMDIDMSSIAKAGGYSNNKMDFYYGMIPMGEYRDSSQLIMLKDYIITYLDQGFAISVPGYSKISSTDDTLEFNCSLNGAAAYSKTKLLYNGTDVYMVMLICETKDQDSMAPKFSRILNSITFK